jgi:TPP-dependent pyruvate/acetoin dehydrogenase alpha subunit
MLLLSMELIKQDLVDFEDKVADAFNSGKIKAPIHLYSGNEDLLINIFKSISKDDWVFCSWRSHYQCLLKGVPESDLFEAILEGRSIALSFLEYKIFSSAIVSGQIPIALGVAMSIKREFSKEKVFCFLGDMTAETGIAQSAFAYAENFDLPITFIVEDNGISVCTDTRQTWGVKKLRFEESDNKKIITYKYSNKYPHAGAGKRVQF